MATDAQAAKILRPRIRNRKFMTDAIFSIKHHYAERIYSGDKRVELRRKAPKKPTERAWIYETAPVKKTGSNPAQS